MTNQRRDAMTPRRRGRIGRRLLGRRLIGGMLPAVFAIAVAAPVAVAADSSSTETVVRSHFELARASLEEGNIGIIVSAVDFVDAVEGPGTNTAVDVFFPGGECLATGPLGFEPRGLSGAQVSGELTAECFDETLAISFSANVIVDLAWTGFGPANRIRFPSDPSDPCHINRVEREARVAGFVTVDGPDAGLEIKATPAGDGFHHLIRQHDACRVTSP